jgi:uncharacterized membrane protein
MKPVIGMVRSLAAVAASACVFALSSAPAAAQVTYTISDFGPANCMPSAIDNSLVAVGQCDWTAATWTNRVSTSLGRLPNGTYSVAVAFNSQGVAVGNGDVGNSRPHATLYRNGTVIDIAPSAANAYAVYVSESNAIVGNYLKGFGTCNSWVAAIWTEDPKKPGSFRSLDLQPFPGGDGKVRCEFANAANQSLQVVGMVQNSLFGQRGAFWDNDAKHTLSLLQPLSGDGGSFAWAVNDVGVAVGDSGWRAVLWMNDAAHMPVQLPMLGADNFATARLVNNLGHAVGFSGVLGTAPATGTSRVVIWRDGGVFELQSLLEPVSGAGWTITSVSAMNGIGQIVGSGWYNGQLRNFVMTPAGQ